ncbi:MAG: COX15/CtaA family protein [Pannonibacter indicus]
MFAVQKRIPKTLIWPLVGLFVLGGFQGFLGWWMVSSGLSELTSVSQYRLAAHLSAACVLWLALIWVARGLEPPVRDRKPSSGWTFAVWGLLGMLFLQIAAGAFVAGLDAGSSHNTWPLMDGQIIPAGLLAMDPAWRNVFENVMTVQFQHRLGAYVLVLAVVALVVMTLRTNAHKGLRGTALLLGLAVLLQAAIGIVTLLLHVKLDVALTHQAMAVIVLGLSVEYLVRLKGEAPFRS